MMIQVYKGLDKALKLFGHIIMGVQLILFLTVLITAAYWLFDLIGLKLLVIVEPFASFITKFIHSFYHQQIEIGGQFFDGSLLLYDLIALAVIFALSRLREQLGLLNSSVEKSIYTYKNKKEIEFNKQLQKEVEKKILKLKNIALMIEFEMKNATVSDFWGGDKDAGVKEKIEEAFKDFHSSLKAFPNIKMAKTDNKMLILTQDFEKFEQLLDIVNNSISELKTKYKRKRWILNFYAAVDIYGDKTPVKEVYPTLQNLLNLRVASEILSMGNIEIRHNMLKTKTYEINKKGVYDLGEEKNVSIMTIIKKY